MSIKLVLLKSGEKIISDVKEGISEEKIVTYILKQPCRISVEETCRILDDEDNGNFENKIRISLSQWPPFSLDNTVLVPTDWVGTIVEPNKDLTEMYKNRVLENGKNDKSTAADEPVNFTDSN